MCNRDPRLEPSFYLRLAALLCLGLLSATLTLAILHTGGLP